MWQFSRCLVSQLACLTRPMIQFYGRINYRCHPLIMTTIPFLTYPILTQFASPNDLIIISRSDNWAKVVHYQTALVYFRGCLRPKTTMFHQCLTFHILFYFKRAQKASQNKQDFTLITMYTICLKGDASENNNRRARIQYSECRSQYTIKVSTFISSSQKNIISSTQLDSKAGSKRLK